jgi:heme A synthase
MKIMWQLHIVLITPLLISATGILTSTRAREFSRLKWPECGGDHLPLSHSRVKNECSSSFPVRLHGMHREHFAFLACADSARLKPFQVTQFQAYAT